MALYKGNHRIAGGTTPIPDDISDKIINFTDNGSVDNIESIGAILDELTTGNQSSKLMANIKRGLQFLANQIESIIAKMTTIEKNIHTVDVKVDTYKNFVGVNDTRDTNETPAWYMKKYACDVVPEFKAGSVIGIDGLTDGFVVLITFIPWSDSSGSRPIQLAFNKQQIWHRYATSDTAWSLWIER